MRVEKKERDKSKLGVASKHKRESEQSGSNQNKLDYNFPKNKILTRKSHKEYVSSEKAHAKSKTQNKLLTPDD